LLNETSDTLADGADLGTQKLLKYFEVSSDLAIVATVLDPRCKMEYYNENYQIYDDHLRIVQRYWDMYKPPSTQVVRTDSEVLPSFFSKRQRVDEDDELATYLKESLAGTGVNALKWWSSQSSSPNLQRMAKDFLAVPATSASGERAFSSAKLFMPANRCSLNAKTMEALVLLRNWKHFSRNYIEQLEDSDSEEQIIVVDDE
jgi:hypothetical protein